MGRTIAPRFFAGGALLRAILVVLASLGLLFASLKLAVTLKRFNGSLDSEIDLAGTLPICGALGVALSFLLRKPWRSRAYQPITRRSAALILAAIVVGVFAVARVTTPRVAFGTGQFGTGYGYDGQIYGVMTERFGHSGPVTPPLSYRFLVPMIVHYARVNTFHGYELINLLSYVGTCILAYKLARHYAASRAAALVIVFGVASLKLGLKTWLYCPIQMDAAGMALSLAIVYAVVRKADLAYVLLMVTAVGVRENLLLLMGFHALHHLRNSRRPWDVVRVLALQAFPIAAFVISRWHPVFMPHPSATGPLNLLEMWFREFLVTPARQGVIAMGFVNALGFLPLVAVVYGRSLWRFLTSLPEWSYLLIATIALAIIGGADVERFANWLAPFAVAAMAWLGARRRAAHLTRTAWLHWLLLYALAMNLPVYWFPSEEFYRTRWSITAIYPAYAWLTLSACTFVMIAGIMLLHQSQTAQRARSDAVRFRPSALAFVAASAYQRRSPLSQEFPARHFLPPLVGATRAESCRSGWP